MIYAGVVSYGADSKNLDDIQRFYCASVARKVLPSYGSYEKAVGQKKWQGRGYYDMVLIFRSYMFVQCWPVCTSVLFPIISIVSMLFNVSVSKLYFKDKFNMIQFAGIGLGIISVLLI